MNAIYALPTFTQEQYDREFKLFERSADWELKNIIKALNMMRFLNTAEQEARLKAVSNILKGRRLRRREQERF